MWNGVPDLDSSASQSSPRSKKIICMLLSLQTNVSYIRSCNASTDNPFRSFSARDCTTLFISITPSSATTMNVSSSSSSLAGSTIRGALSNTCRSTTCCASTADANASLLESATALEAWSYLPF